MNIYLLTNNQRIDYDQYDSFVIAAKTKEDAINLSIKYTRNCRSSWNIEYITAHLVGKSNSKARKIICSSFNAG